MVLENPERLVRPGFDARGLWAKLAWAHVVEQAIMRCHALPCLEKADRCLAVRDLHHGDLQLKRGDPWEWAGCSCDYIE